MKLPPSIPSLRLFRRRFPWRVLLLTSVVLIRSPWIQAQTDQSNAPRPQLLLPVELTTAAAAGPSQPWVQGHQRLLRLNPELDAQAGDWLRPGHEVRLDLLESQDVTFRVRGAQRADDGALELTGDSPTSPGSHIQLVLAAGELSGVATLPGLGSFQWTPAGSGATQVSRLPSGSHFLCATPEPPPGLDGLESSTGTHVVRHALVNGVWNPETELTVIDILMLYSTNSVAAQGSEPELRRSLLKAVDSANFRFTNSLVGVRLNPVFLGPINWAESGSLQTDWQTMHSESRIAALRNDYKADLVYLVVEGDNFGWGAIASIAPAGGNPDRAFAALRRFIFTGVPNSPAPAENFVLAHETGHMLGAHHDREHAFDINLNLDQGAYNYSYGHRFAAREITYTTIMSYDPGTPVPFFSNPNLTFDGVPVGVPVTETNRADNAQTLNRLAPLVANYRTALSRVEFVQPDLVVTEADGAITVPLRRTGDLNTATRVAVSFDSASPAKSGLDYTRPASVLVSFATNQATAEIVIPILQDDLIEGDESLRLTLSGVVGNHGLGTNSACRITLRDDEAALVVSPATVSLREDGPEAEVSVEFMGPLLGGVTHEVALTVGRAGDTATAGQDYEVTPGTLTFTESGRRQTFRVRALPDGVVETDETARITLGNATVTVRLQDVDRPGALLAVAVPDAAVGVLVALPTGGTLVAGDFTQLGDIRRTAIARLRADGTVDPNFVPPTLQASPVEIPGMMAARVFCAIPDRQSRFLVGGLIGTVAGQPGHNLVRLRSDGSPDPTFAAPEFNGSVLTVTEQPDGKLVVGGAFDQVSGVKQRGLTRLNPDGSPDPTFQAQPGLTGSLGVCGSVAQLPDGRLLVGGQLENYNGQPVRNLLRLQADGRFDETFPLRASGASGGVTALAALPDGSAYVGGVFDLIGGRNFRRLARLKPDGSLDLTFAAPRPNGEIQRLLPLPNGQVLVAGNFTTIALAPRRYVALLNANGTVDSSFDLGRGAGDYVWALAASGDGTLSLGGVLKSFNDQPAPYLARLRLPTIGAAFAGTGSGADGALRATVVGLPGGVYPVESSTDLERWQPAGEVRLDGSEREADFVAPTSASDARFFRFKSPNP